MSVECQVNIKSQSELDNGGSETCSFKSEVDTKDGSIMIRKRILEEIRITNHVLVKYKDSFKILIFHFNCEISPFFCQR